MMILHPELVNEICSVCGKSVQNKIALYPKDVLEQIKNNISFVPEDYHVQYLESKKLFKPYLHYTADSPVLVIRYDSYVYVLNDVLTLVTDKATIKYGATLSQLSSYKNAANMLFMAVIDLCKELPHFYGIIKSAQHLLWKFVRDLCSVFDLRGTCTIPTDIESTVFTVSEKHDFSVYTFVANNSVPIGELRVRGNKLTVISKSADGYNSISYTMVDDDRFAKRIAIITLAYMHGIVLELNCCYTFGGLQIWPEEKRIPCYGSFVFE